MGEPRFDFANARASGLEPATIHIASGNEPRLKQDEGMFFAPSEHRPHAIVRALAEEAKTRKALIYRGRRFLGWPSDPLWKTLAARKPLTGFDGCVDRDREDVAN